MNHNTVNSRRLARVVVL